MSILQHDEAQQLQQLVYAAGSRLLDYWPGAGTPNEHLAISQKIDGSRVTSADFASNAVIVSGLKRLFPNDGIISEEIVTDLATRHATRVWIVDPLDGTETFIQGNDDFAILLALTVDGRAEFGTMYFPARNVIAVAERGRGATLDGVPLRCNSEPRLRKGKLNIRHAQITATDLQNDRWIDSGMAFFNLCRGALDAIIIGIDKHGEWDLAAPSILVEESGGRVSDERGRPISFNRESLDFRYFIASNGKVHDEVLDLLPRASGADAR